MSEADDAIDREPAGEAAHIATYTSTLDDERMLFQRACSGDGTAFAVLFRTHARACIRLARQYVRDPNSASDIVHDVFLALWLDPPASDVHTSVREYVLRAVRNRALNVLRHERVIERHAELEGMFPRAAYNAGELAVESDALATAINDALNALSPRVREIFVLHREVGLAPAEIAAVFGISVATVYNQLSKALKELTIRLGDWGRM